MIFGLKDGVFFVIDNETTQIENCRLISNPANWFRNAYGLIAPMSVNNGEGINGWNLDDAVKYIGKRTHNSQTSTMLGFGVFGDDLCSIATIKSPLNKHLPHLKSNGEFYHPVIYRITDLEWQMEFIFAERAMANCPMDASNSLNMTTVEFINDVYLRSLASRTSGEFGYLYTISVDDLKKCQALREEKKFNEITALWSCKELAEVTITEVTFDDLKPFNWASVEMM